MNPYLNQTNQTSIDISSFIYKNERDTSQIIDILNLFSDEEDEDSRKEKEKFDEEESLFENEIKIKFVNLSIDLNRIDENASKLPRRYSFTKENNKQMNKFDCEDNLDYIFFYKKLICLMKQHKQYKTKYSLIQNLLYISNSRKGSLFLQSLIKNISQEMAWFIYKIVSIS